MTGMRLSLPEASGNALQVDTAFFAVFGIAAVIFVVLFILLVVFSIRYRRGTRAKRGPLPNLLRREIEIGWTTATTFVAIFIFWWFAGGSALPSRAAPNQLEIHIVAKQWMWKAEHPDGAREIDALHLPVNIPVRLVMTSEDVIHSFFVPAFRVKQDVLPARNEELAFTPTVTGEFHLFCAEFCGTQHSHMTGDIVVLTQPNYARWLGLQRHGDSLVRDGEALFANFGCGACHAPASRVHAPKLAGLYGSSVQSTDGRRVTADDTYLRNAILHPRDGIVAGYAPIMPSYSGLAGPAEVDALIAYLKSLSGRQAEQ
jgi:cytochrome c oxidase subunit 2